ncbi:MAG: family 10 glycosylhydrolase [Desulfobacteraceae bacterium]|nr:MAG: family 10 glycosylhydrolase [Desulfobacteraceae bacterium]
MRQYLLILSAMVCGFFAQAKAQMAAWKPVWKSDATSAFEVETQLRPWTIYDEGMSTILDNVQSMAGVNSIYLIVVMHQEHRPFHAPEFPHNPVRDSFKAEDSRVSFFPDMKRYGRIKPLLSDYDWIRDTDWLALVVDSCRARGLRVGAEVSHFPIPKQLVRANPDWQQKKINGEPWSAIRFCPNHPDTREYVIALFGDIVANYDVDYIQTCQYLFNDKDIDEGGTCFCRHCIDEAKETGFDLEAAIPILKKNKNAQPERDKWLAFRRNSTTKLYREISGKIKQENPKCHLRLNDVFVWSGRDALSFGLDLKAVAPYLGSIVNQDHQEQKGKSNETFDLRKRWLETNRNSIGPDKPLICSIAPRMDAFPGLVKAGIKVALEHPAKVNGLAMKHYDGASFSLMRAFRQGMIEAGVQGLVPTIGKEVEDMKLDNYMPFREELVEEWGIQTNRVGKASYIFNEPSGIYDVRITYFDEKQGKSRVTLFIDGQERVAFELDEDTDCWRWRLFEKIHVNKGDDIILEGKADQKEQAKLDYIEFIRHVD